MGVKMLASQIDPGPADGLPCPGHGVEGVEGVVRVARNMASRSAAGSGQVRRTVTSSEGGQYGGVESPAWARGPPPAPFASNPT